jgi:nucleotide-binding universal stress UspA family protein
LGVKYTTSLAVGQVDEQIIQRARWADMVVINQRMVHGRWVQRPLGTIFQTVVTQAARPILAVPGTEVRPIQQILLAYDGSNQAREALFVFRHLVSCWRVPGTILTVEGGHCDRETLDLAWQYVQEAAEATMVHTRYEQGEVADVILRAVEEEKADLLLMGSYGYQPLLKAFLGSTVDRVLRQAWFPVLICH